MFLLRFCEGSIWDYHACLIWKLLRAQDLFAAKIFLQNSEVNGQKIPSDSSKEYSIYSRSKYIGGGVRETS